MGFFTLEHSKVVYWMDFVVYGGAILALALWLVADAPRERWPVLAACVAAGLALWTLIEYLLHRFVLHGVQPFRGWHAEHHRRPAALIGLPTYMSSVLFATLVLAPAWWIGGGWFARSLTLGVLAGYLAFAVMHHASHHVRAGPAWLIRRKRWHALHHGSTDRPLGFGVTSAFWDHVFRSGVSVTAADRKGRP
ncbi:MAG: sterol desaturase family protein [Burkholderiales bacterium]|nr:sterol desaturase family protein [Burkholderiales bacterium]MDE2456268.1 sterol desaturase family protein [Burkholderiales bacterium]